MTPEDRSNTLNANTGQPNDTSEPEHCLPSNVIPDRGQVFSGAELTAR